MKEINLNEKIFLYDRIDYSKPAPHPLLAPKPIRMTENEAHARNQGFSLNHVTQRYIKRESVQSK